MSLIFHKWTHSSNRFDDRSEGNKLFCKERIRKIIISNKVFPTRYWNLAGVQVT